jgi:hypothetical protein
MPAAMESHSLCRRIQLLLSPLALVTLFGLSANAQAPATYFEFGTVVAINRSSVDIQTTDRERQRVVQHSFTLSRETRADIVHVGDAVEVVFTPGEQWSLRRMIVLPAGIPVAGPPPSRAAALASPSPAQAATPVTSSMVAPVEQVQLGATDAKTAKKRVHTTKPALPNASVSAPPPQVKPGLLGSNAQPVLAGVVPVTLGSPAEVKARAASGTANSVSIDRPAEECNRSSADWPTQPLRVAVLDFRYPTEREEAHDVGTTGGGSGTAVADLVFARLEEDEQNDDRFLFSRADRRRLDRSDFAGAARLGRQLGVDAVLAGTFIPVEQPLDANGFETGPRTFELRAGIVDTCTGQLLVQSSSVSCKGAISPGITSGADPKACSRYAVSAAETANPKAFASNFKPPLDALLYPLEHPGPSRPDGVSVGAVSRVSADRVTVQLTAHLSLRPGDQLTLYASRLAKNPTTYTLHNLQDEEIGRLSVETVESGQASGSFAGDFVPRIGDRAEVSK